jgi:TetR/AcrR family transcriptional repressor of bet genes
MTSAMSDGTTRPVHASGMLHGATPRAIDDLEHPALDRHGEPTARSRAKTAAHRHEPADQQAERDSSGGHEEHEQVPGEAAEDRHPSMVGSIGWIYNQSMGRRSMRAERRVEITHAFARVLARHGYARATIAAVAQQAGVAPGLVHHYFASKEDLLASLVGELIQRFRARTRTLDAGADPLDAYVTAALALGETADAVAARCWVGVFAEAVRDPGLFARIRRLVDTETEAIRRRGGARFTRHDAGAVLAFIIGSLVLGAFAPHRTAGFAAPSLRRLMTALRTAR